MKKNRKHPIQISCIVFLVFSIISMLLPFRALSKEYQPLESILLSDTTRLLQTKEIVYSFSPHQLSTFQETSALSIPACQSVACPGKPLLWFQEHQIAVPENFYIQSIHLESISSKMVTLDASSWDIPKDSLYSAKHSFRNVPGAILFSKKLSQYPSCYFKTSIPTGSSNIAMITLFPVVYISEYQAECITEFNFAVRVTPCCTGVTTRYNRTQGNQDECGLIITDDAFHEEAERLQSIQSKNGIESKIVFQSDLDHFTELKPVLPKGILGFEDVDTSFLQYYDSSFAYRIRKCITEHSKRKSISYVTILGDASIIPPSYYVYSEQNETDYQKWIPTDIFYADISSSETFVIPTISVGRIPCNTPEQADKMLDNIEESNKVFASNTHQGVLIAGGDPFPSDSFFAELTQLHLVNRDIIPSLLTTKLFTTDNNYNNQDIMSSLEKTSYPYSWIFGHGDGKDLFLEDDKLIIDETASIYATKQQGLLISESCGNGSYDQSIVTDDGDSFSQNLISSDIGFSSYFGCTRDSWCGWDYSIKEGFPTVEKLFYSEALIESLFVSLSQSNNNTIGKAVTNAFSQYINNTYPDSSDPYLKTLFGFVYLGDPTTCNSMSTVESGCECPLPVISKTDEKRFESSGLPLYSTKEAIHLQMESDSEFVILSMFDMHANDIVFRKKITSSDRSVEGVEHFYVTFPAPEKSDYILRFETDTDKELRYYLRGAKPHDLSLTPEIDTCLLSSGEEKEYHLMISNNGYSVEENIEVSVAIDGEQVASTMFSSIPPGNYRDFYCSYSSLDMGEKKAVFTLASSYCNSYVQETITVTADPILRVGVLCSEDCSNQDFLENEFLMQNLNKDFSKRSKNISLSVLPFGKDLTGRTTFDRLQFDVIVLYANSFHSNSILALLHELVSFEENGGLVFGIMPLGYSNEDAETTKLLQSYFGIDIKEPLRAVQLDEDSGSMFSMMEGYDQYFKSEYKLVSKTGIVAMQNTWDRILLHDNALIAGLSHNGLTSFIRYQNRFLYTSVFSETSFNSFDDSYTFFLDILSYFEGVLQEQREKAIRPSSTGIKDECLTNTSTSTYDEALSAPVFPTSFEVKQEEIWVSTINGFFCSSLSKPGEFSYLPYPEKLIREMHPISFRADNYQPTRAKFRFYKDQILFHSCNQLYLFDPTGRSEKIRTIQPVLYSSFVTPYRQFNSVVDFEVNGDLAYILDSHHSIVAIDICTGRKVFHFSLGLDKGIDLQINNGRIFVLTENKKIQLYSLLGEFLRTILLDTTLEASFRPHSFYIDNENQIYLNVHGDSSNLYVISSQSIETNCSIEMFKLPIKSDQSFEKFSIFDHHLVTVKHMSNAKESYLSGVGEWIVYNTYTQKIEASSENSHDFYKDTGRFIFTDEMWVLKDGSLLVSQQKPFSSVLNIFSGSTFDWIYSINIAEFAPFSTYRSLCYSEIDGYVYCLCSNPTETFILAFDPLQKSRWKKISMRTINTHNVCEFVVEGETAYIQHETGLMELYSITTGKILNSFLPISSDFQNYPSEISKISIGNKHIYLFDEKTGQIFGFSNAGELAYFYSVPVDDSSHAFSFKLLQTGEIAYLDIGTNTLGVLHENRMIAKYNIPHFPVSFHFSAKNFIVYDLYYGYTKYFR